MIYLSMDVGTSSTKISILDDGLRELQTARAEYPCVLLPGSKVEMDPEVLFAAISKAAWQLDADLRRRVEVVCYDAFSPSPVLIGESGKLAYPRIITHLDRRSREQSAFIDARVGRDRYLSIAGFHPFVGGSGVLALLWIRQNAPHYLAGTHQVGHLTSYIHKRLTGEWMTDLVNASMLGVYETTTQAGWSRALIDAFELDERWFGPIYNPGKSLGTLLPEMAELMGVRSGVPVTVGTNDMAAAQVGAGNTEPGCIMDTAGSSDMVSILTDVPVVSPHYYLRNSALPGMWQIYATTAGGFALDWFYEQFVRDISRDEFYRTFVAKALDEHMDDDAVTFDPYLTGDRQSMEVKTGAWHGLTLATTREEMLAALLKSMARVLSATICQAKDIVELKSVIKLSGGLSNEPYLRLKRREIPGFAFEVVDNCPIRGNVRLAQRYS